jgi:general secretion pathway protein C
MEIRLNERHIMALNFLLVAVLAYFAAVSVNDIIAMRLTPSQAALPRAVSRIDDGTPINRPRKAYQEIVQRDIFNLQAAPQEHKEVVEQLDLHLTLIGVSSFSTGKPFAIIENASGQQGVYKVGDVIPAGAGKLIEVDADRAVIDHNGKRVAINLPKEDLPGPVMSAKPIEVPAAVDSADDADSTDEAFDPNVEDLGDNHYKIPKGTLDHSMSNLSQLLTQIRAVPNIQDGKTNGFALSEIEPGSVFDEMGLEEGDVIRSVNGQSITDPAQAMGMMGALSNQTHLTVQVFRDGKPTTLIYQIQ